MGRATVLQKLSAVGDLIRLTKQYGTILVLCPTLWSLYIASSGNPTLKVLLIFIAGTFLMRSAGCTINDIADRRFDRCVERTKTRPLADGRLTTREAISVFLMLILLAFCLVLLLNPLTILLSFFGITVAIIYPFVKRVSHFPQVVLGIAFGWGAVMAWSAVRNSIGLVALLIFAANIFWSTAYDTVYAMMDIDDDRRIGVKSTAIFFGPHVYKALFILHAFFIIISAIAGYAAGLAAPFYVSLSVAFVILNYMILKLRESPTRETTFMMFVANCVVGALILIGITMSFSMGVG